MKTTRESWWEAEVHRVAGEAALQSPKPDAPKAEACFERALAVARKQQATSLELRASSQQQTHRYAQPVLLSAAAQHPEGAIELPVNLKRGVRNQGKRDEARDLLAPVYGWFTEGFDTRDLKERRRCSMSCRLEKFQQLILPADQPCEAPAIHGLYLQQTHRACFLPTTQ
jgi:predicted ATPase